MEDWDRQPLWDKIMTVFLLIVFVVVLFLAAAVSMDIGPRERLQPELFDGGA